MKNDKIKKGDIVEFNPLPNRHIDDLAGNKKVAMVRGDGLIILECGNIQLFATKTECVKKE